MENQKKTVKGKHPEQLVITSRDPMEREAFYQATDAEAPLGPFQLAVGHIQHPETDLWQVWISTSGLDITQLAAFKEPAKADSAVEILKREARQGTLSNPALVTGLFKFLERESDGPVQPLPDDLVRKLVQDMAHYVVLLKDKEEKS